MLGGYIYVARNGKGLIEHLPSCLLKTTLATKMLAKMGDFKPFLLCLSFFVLPAFLGNILPEILAP